MCVKKRKEYQKDDYIKNQPSYKKFKMANRGQKYFDKITRKNKKTKIKLCQLLATL
jgi:hypothetical protein